MASLEDKVKGAVRHFWATRLSQADHQGSLAGVRDYGERTAVTGGKQLDGFAKIVSDLIEAEGIKQACVYRNAKKELPGYFRPTKDWDLVVVVRGDLLAAMEFKSQVGPSFGNNFNNRTEEALGNAVDILKAYENGAFRPSQKPWLGFVMLLEETEKSLSPVSVAEPHFRVFKEFKSASYARRYELLCEKLVRERLYDATCLILAKKTEAATGAYWEPNPELSMKMFVASLAGRMAGYVKAHRS